MKKATLLLLFLMLLSVTPGEAADSLSIQKLLFVDSIQSLGIYEPRPGNRFTLDDACNIYVETSGFASPLTLNTQDEYNVNLAVDVRIKLPQSGRTLAFQPDTAQLNTKLRTRVPTQFFGIGFAFDGWAPGNYVLEVGVRDNLGGQTVSRDIAIQLVEPTEADVKARQEREAEQQQQGEEEAQPAPRQ